MSDPPFHSNYPRNLKKCMRCGWECDGSFVYCPRCGGFLTPEDRRKAALAKVSGLFIISAGGFIGLLASCAAMIGRSWDVWGSAMFAGLIAVSIVAFGVKTLKKY